MKTETFDKEKIWKTVLSAMKIDVSEASFNAYLKNTQLYGIKEAGQRFIGEVGCSSAFIKNTLEQRYWGQLNLELEKALGNKCEIVFNVWERKTIEPETLAGPLFEEKRTDNYVYACKKANLKEDFIFENYAVGGSNQMAYAASQAVSKKVGTAYNPLFIWGGVGVGKTHLMQAIGHEVIKAGGQGVLFSSGEEFTNDLVEAIRYKSTEKVRAKYRKLKLLMIDDVQFIAGKPSVQEEFFHTFNTLLREGGQVVMTCDKPPGDIAKLEERLRSRFGAGLIVDIGPADFELRTAILLIKAKQRGYDLKMETAQLIAEKIEGVRELQGFLIKMETEEKLRGKELSQEELERILKVNGEESNKSRIITPTEVINAISSYYSVGVQQLKGERRTKTIAWPRQILMYLLRQDLRLPLEEVGRLIGGRDHTTVLHAAEKVKGEIEQNHRFQAELAEVRKRIFNLGVS